MERWFFDVETYKQYDGKNEEEILSLMEGDEIKEFFKTKRKVGFYYPVLDPKEVKIFCFKRDGSKKAKYFYDKASALKFVLERINKNSKGKMYKEDNKEHHRRTYFYGHGSRYDAYSLFGNLLDNVNEIKIIKERPLFMMIGKWGYFLDTMGLMGAGEEGKALHNLGAELGIPKLNMPMEVKEPSDLKQYVTRDVEITQRFYVELRNVIEKLYGIKLRKLFTAGQIAMSIWMNVIDKIKVNYTNYYGETRKVPMSSFLMRDRKLIPPKSKDNVLMIRQACRGARCSCLHKGFYEGITYLDINSLYPQSMSIMDMPDLSTETRIINPEKEYTKEQILDMIGVAKAIVKFPKTKIGYLGTWGTTGTGTYFPTEKTIEDIWTLFELKQAVKEGYEIKEIKEMIVYKKLPFNPFTEHMRRLYEEKQQSKGIMKLVIKMLMNSLWGKFGEINELYEKIEVEARDSDKLISDGYKKIRTHGTKYILGKIIGYKLKRHTHPIISAYVTAYGRDRIYQEMKKIPYEDLIYVDTDALQFTGDYKKDFTINDNMGEFKVVYEGVNGLYSKRKIYRIFDKEGKVLTTKMAGNVNRQGLTNEQLTGDEEYIVKSTYTAKRALRTGNYDKLGTNIKTTKKVDQIEKDIYYPENWKSFRKDKILLTKEQEVIMA